MKCNGCTFFMPHYNSTIGIRIIDGGLCMSLHTTLNAQDINKNHHCFDPGKIGQNDAPEIIPDKPRKLILT